MPSEITMPQQSDTMTEGTVGKWLKKEGDKVKEGDVIAEIETDKATMEMEAFEAGTIAVIKAPEGTKVPVGELIAVLATKNESVDDVKKKFASGNGSAAVAAEPPQPRTQVRGEQREQQQGRAAGTTAAPPEAVTAKRREEEEGGGVPGGPLEQGRAQSRFESVQEPPEHTSEAMSREARQHVTDARGPSGQSPIRHFGDDRVRISPLAKKIADEKGIDITRIQGSGPNGRIVKEDVLNFAEERGIQPATQHAEVRSLKPEVPAGSQLPVPAPRLSAGKTEVVPLTKIRGVIAKRLQQSKQNIPHFYETVDCDVEELTQIRVKLNEQLKPLNIKLSIGDLVSKAIATALTEHPALNAHFNGSEISRFGDVNLGMAVALPDGLIVPVLRGVNYMGFREIRVRSADLVERARAQRLKQDEMTGATFTVSNLGMFGVREFSAIINPPEVGILAVGGAEKRAVVRGDQIVARTMMTLTLSADHRAVDGATAAEFLTTLRQLLEEPAMMLA
jgi:pyruvate dehydrogenase E2 component (dihydrolipoyllysine-residue acetyltransferase)